MGCLHLTKHLIRVKLDSCYTLWVNLLTGALDLVYNDSPLNNLSIGEKVSYTTVKRYMDFYNKGYFLTAEEEHLLYKQLLCAYKEYLRFNKYIHVVFVPTSLCNFSCPYCINYLSRSEALKSNQSKTNFQVISTSQTEGAFNFLDRLCAEGAKINNNGIGLYGGEPLLDICIPFLETLIVESRKRGLTVSVITNGSFTSRVRSLIQKNLDVFRYMKFTLDGPKEIHNARRTTAARTDTFSIITKNIDWALENGLTVDIRTNLDTKNISYYQELAEFFQKKGWYKKINIFQPSPVKSNFALCKGNTLIKERFIDELSKIIGGNESLSILKIKENIISRYAEPVYSLFLKKDKIGKFVYTPRFARCATAEGKTLNFAWDGKIYSCFNGVGEKAFEIGSYFPESKIDEKPHDYWSNFWQNSSPQACKECNYRLACGGPCPYTYFLDKDKSNFCNYFKDYFDDAVRAARSEIYAKAHAISKFFL